MALPEEKPLPQLSSSVYKQGKEYALTADKDIIATKE